nr:immunoglobulin light chain junction region [Macaca mulatta]MOX42048.1 immunoglobulin light chain junction region [Macaca mulatta]MOX42540.1 immunoglobulin light chain junction region [Macaca mulatta]MOX43878.1 immunoglobulin light chain junction region [Macaca mulatta]MOX44087.1 immunoglobulin light chain junction region [Macaca mulatta]
DFYCYSTDTSGNHGLF